MHYGVYSQFITDREDLVVTAHFSCDSGRFILGVDPGFSGAWCVTEIEQNKATIHDMLDMPKLAEGALVFSSRKRPEIDGVKVATFVKRWAPHLRLAVVEDVFAMPEQGLSSTFRFGAGFGLIIGVLSCLEIRTLRAKPAVWKAQMGVTADKRTSIIKARELAPESQKLFDKRKYDGRAEALLLAVFGARSLGLDLRGNTGETINDIL